MCLARNQDVGGTDIVMHDLGNMQDLQQRVFVSEAYAIDGTGALAIIDIPSGDPQPRITGQH